MGKCVPPGPADRLPGVARPYARPAAIPVPRPGAVGTLDPAVRPARSGADARCAAELRGRRRRYAGDAQLGGPGERRRGANHQVPVPSGRGRHGAVGHGLDRHSGRSGHRYRRGRRDQLHGLLAHQRHAVRVGDSRLRLGRRGHRRRSANGHTHVGCLRGAQLRHLAQHLHGDGDGRGGFGSLYGFHEEASVGGLASEQFSIGTRICTLDRVMVYVLGTLVGNPGRRAGERSASDLCPAPIWRPRSISGAARASSTPLSRRWKTPCGCSGPFAGRRRSGLSSFAIRPHARLFLTFTPIG